VDHNYSLDALKQFLHFVGDKGLVSGTVAQGWRVAVGKILQDLSDAEAADVRKIDIELALRKFVNRNPGKLSPSSLAEYRRRATSAIEEFVGWAEDPTGYRPRSGASSRLSNTTKRTGTPTNDKKKAKASTDVQAQSSSRSLADSAPTSPSPSPAPSPSGGLPLPFPMRPDFLAQVVIPRDMTTEEAKRLGAFLLTLAVDFRGG
jgi:hypothetical protein